MINDTCKEKIERLQSSLGIFGLLGLVALTAGGCLVSAAGEPVANSTEQGIGTSHGEKSSPDKRDAGCDEDADAGNNADADAGNNADADGGCACTPNGVVGLQSLSCFCSADACPQYDAAVLLCPPSPFPEDNRVDTYADCNLVVVEYSFGFDYGRYVYDATTHVLLGALYGTDFDAYTCGSERVFAVQAGVLPPPGCLVSQTALRCVDAH